MQTIYLCLFYKHIVVDSAFVLVYLRLMKRENLPKVEFYRQLGAKIRRFRTQRKLSQDGLAKLVGLTRTSLTNIEQGRQHPPLHKFCEIVEQLRVDISELLPIPAVIRSIDLKALAGAQVRKEDELEFIETTIKGEKIT
jgi:transcriptional regulator with XRE-family HTH domain